MSGTRTGFEKAVVRGRILELYVSYLDLPQTVRKTFYQFKLKYHYL
jgi:hypothetical protein